MIFFFVFLIFKILIFGQKICDDAGFKKQEIYIALSYSVFHFSGAALDIIYPHILDTWPCYSNTHINSDIAAFSVHLPIGDVKYI